MLFHAAPIVTTPVRLVNTGSPTPRRQFVRRALIVASFVLFPVTIFYFSAALVVMGALQGVLAGSGMVFIAQFLSALVLGRAFCGWLCPGAGLQEACFMVQPKRVNLARCDGIKYAIWLPWVGTIVYLFARTGLRTVDFQFMMDSPVSLSAPQHHGVYLIVTGLILTLSLAVGKRGFCHAACWMAPFLILGSRTQRLMRLPVLHLRTDPDKCRSCHGCDFNCPMSLYVAGMVQRGDMTHAECILCGNCVDTFQNRAISVAFGPTPKRTPLPQGNASHRR